MRLQFWLLDPCFFRRRLGDDHVTRCLKFLNWRSQLRGLEFLIADVCDDSMRDGFGRQSGCLIGRRPHPMLRNCILHDFLEIADALASLPETMNDASM